MNPAQTPLPSPAPRKSYNLSVLILSIVSSLLVGILIGVFLGMSFRGPSDNVIYSPATRFFDEKESEETLIVSSSNVRQLAANITPWTGEQFDFSAKQFYLVPVLADLARFKGVYKENEVADKAFVAVEVFAQNVSPVASSDFSKRVIPAENYFRISFPDGSVVAPIFGNYKWLSPQETGTVYVILPVPENTSEVSLLVGPLHDQQRVQLDFTSAQAEQAKGQFLIQEGLQ